MKELLDLYNAWRADGLEVGRAVVIRTYGSAPRPEGAVLLYSSDGRVAGSVSGGCVEAAAADEIDDARKSRDVVDSALRNHRRAGLERRPGLWRND